MTLNHSRFAGILCGPVRTKTMVYNPFLMEEVVKAKRLLEDTKGIFSSRELVEKFNAKSQEKMSGAERDWKDWLENLTMSPVQIPPFGRPQDYERFVQQHHLLLTEIFSPVWERFLGSSRHLSIGNVQMKGCGLTLPVLNYQYMNGSGIYDLSLALKSFIFSGLIDTSVPLGSAHAIAVQRAPWSSPENSLGIFLREMKTPRMIQIGPELSQTEQQSIRSMIKSKTGVDTARELSELISAQLASMVVIGGRANCSTDNLLVDGQFIDEETWIWPEDLGSQRLSFDFKCEQGNFDWKTAKFAMSTCAHMKKSLEDLRKYLAFIYGSSLVPSLDDLEKSFQAYIQRAIPDFDWNVWNRGLEFSHAYDSRDFQSWLKVLEKDGWVQSTEYFKDQGMILHLRKPCKESTGLAEKFNRQHRPDFWKMAIKLSKLNPEDIDVDELSNNIQIQIGASGFVLPFRFVQGRGLTENKLQLKAFFELTFQKWPLLKGKTIDMIVWDGTSEVTLNNVSSSTKLERDCIPLTFKVHGLSDRAFHLACMKTVLVSG